MKIKFNHYERVAGLFVLVSIVAAISFTVTTAIKQGWFASKITYSTIVESADGLHIGTAVHVGGLKAGQVSEIELVSRHEVVLKLEVLDNFMTNIKEDSSVQIVRPFVLGEKVLEISVGSIEAPVAAKNTRLASASSFDLMDLFSGKKLGPIMGQFEGLISNISTLAKAFADPKRTQAFIKMFDRIDPLIVNLNKMSIEVTELTGELNQIVPQIKSEAPEFGANIGHLVLRLDKLTKILQPTLEDVGPELPRVSRRAVEALDEMVVTLKAIQKSFLLSGKVEDVREEEARKRKPSSDK